MIRRADVEDVEARGPAALAGLAAANQATRGPCKPRPLRCATSLGRSVFLSVFSSVCMSLRSAVEGWRVSGAAVLGAGFMLAAEELLGDVDHMQVHEGYM